MNYTKPKTFVIHKNDAGTDAYRDQYVHALEAEIERLRAIVDKSPKTIVLPKANERAMLNGWKLDWKFLDAIHWKTDIAMEDIESVLLAAHEVCATREAAEAARETK
jgi:hypothetical protein